MLKLKNPIKQGIASTYKTRQKDIFNTLTPASEGSNPSSSVIKNPPGINVLGGFLFYQEITPKAI